MIIKIDPISVILGFGMDLVMFRRRVSLSVSLWTPQISISDLGHDENYDLFGEISPRGFSSAALKKLPHHVIEEDASSFGESTICTICLQVPSLSLSLTLLFLLFVLGSADSCTISSYASICRR